MATIVMSAARVIEAAKTTIARIETERAKRDDAMIAKFMVPYTLFGFIVRKAPSRAKVERDLTMNMWGAFPNMYAYETLDHAKKLLTLARYGDPVTLNENDTRTLFP